MLRSTSITRGHLRHFTPGQPPVMMTIPILTVFLVSSVFSVFPVPRSGLEMTEKLDVMTDTHISSKKVFISQRIVDGSASKPALVQDTNYMVEKTYNIAPYLGAFGAYLMPQ